MMLSTKARYAVMAMAELANHKPGRRVKLAELASAQDIPLPYLEQIFATLRQRGLVRASRGPGGGYALARAAVCITIADIVDAMEENRRMTRCEGEAANGCTASKTRCATHDLWEGLERQIAAYLSGIPLSALRGAQGKDVIGKSTL